MLNDVNAPTEAPRSSRLQPRIIKGLQASYNEAEYDPALGNTSQLTVFGTHVLVLVDECATASSGGILLPDDILDNMSEASETGCVYAIGAGAFRRHEDGTQWEGPAPAVGDRVYFERFAGVKAMGLDGRRYRIMHYGVIGAALPSTGDAQ